jgi:membrane protein implicated in regulation of membrane protease activity
MVIIGLLLIVGAVVLSIGILINATGSATLEAFGVSVSTNEAGLFIAGAVAMLAFLIGVWLLLATGKRARRRRREIKDERHQRQTEVERLREENARLEDQARRGRELPPEEARGRTDEVPADRAMPGPHGGTGAERVDLTETEHRTRR